MVSNKCVKKNKEGGFTIIEMLVVTLILVLISVALAAIIKGLVTSSTRIKRLQTVRAQTQEAIHYLTKELRMSEFTRDNGDDSITFNWRKATEDDDYYTTQEVTLNEGSINSFFPEDWAEVQENSFKFKASGTTIEGNEGSKNNRVIIKFNIRVLTSATDKVNTDSADVDEEVIIPIQTMVSLRSYNLTEEE
jgi:type II secretory pathway pseudopilin PulG